MRVPAGRRPGQLRLDRRRSARGLPLHRSASRVARRSDDDGPRQGHRRLPAELRRDHRRAGRPAGAVPEPARQRIDGHRRRHGDEHPAAQHARGHRRRDRGDRAAARARATSGFARCCRRFPAPDFPSGGTIVGREGIYRAYNEGRGGVVVRGKADVRGAQEGRSRLDRHHRDSVSGEQGDARRRHRRARPRQADRRHLRSARRVRPRRHADRHRAQARRAARRRPEQPLQAHEAADELRHHAAGDRRRAGRACSSLLEIVEHFIEFRREVVRRRIEFELRKAEARAHILEGLQDRPRSPRRGHHAHPRIEESGRGARRPRRPSSASRTIQAQAILDMQLQRLTGLERQKILDELAELREDDRAAARASCRATSCSSASSSTS